MQQWIISSQMNICCCTEGCWEYYGQYIWATNQFEGKIIIKKFIVTIRKQKLKFMGYNISESGKSNTHIFNEREAVGYSE